jgi:hypothetical protein
MSITNLKIDVGVKRKGSLLHKFYFIDGIVMVLNVGIE